MRSIRSLSWDIAQELAKSERGYRVANLSGANLSGANLSGADLNRANLSGANLSWANLRGADLSWANLRGADLNRANLSRADLNRANLSGANLSGANLSGADLNRANLSGANLSWANLSWANLSRADLNRANLSGANLSETCVDPLAPPNGECSEFPRRGDGWVNGWRTKATSAAGRRLKTDRIYGCSVFSVADTECHPGWYLWPSLEQAYAFSGRVPMVLVKARPRDIHRAGGKWRSRAIWVLEDV
jgi:hypothetical protein